MIGSRDTKDNSGKSKDQKPSSKVVFNTAEIPITCRLAIAFTILGILLSGVILLGMIIHPSVSPTVEYYTVITIRYVILLSFAIALVLGIISLLVIHFNTKNLKGSHCAIYAITLSIVFYSLFFSFKYAVRRANDIHHEHLRAKAAEGNLHQLGRAIVEYAKNHNGYLPIANKWCDLLIEHDEEISKDTFKNPQEPNGICNFAFNKHLCGLRLANVPNNTVLLFEANGGWNLTGDAKLLKESEPHRKWVILLLLVDGTVDEYWFSGVRGLTPRWIP
ncbi:MAG: hypothetical protein GWN00_32380 [Aliifodinibius sp.]|nr:hypothetical protein [Fodinibius sp.]NIV15461.1 hypothetical protein [Fodinibius sp.]NIY29315.1 hypothetical protein [Fodinibius sp.]